MARLSPDARVVLAHQRTLKQVRDRVTRYVEQRWDSLPDHRDATIDAFVRQVLPVVESGQNQTAQLTSAYLDSLARLAGVTPPPRAAAVIGTTIRGVEAEEVYRRPAKAVYYALSQGTAYNEAVRIGKARLVDIVRTDLQLSQTATAQARMKGDKRITGYERVLTGGEDCLLCTIASTQRYSRGDLLPIHPGCDCTVAPIYGDRSSGQVINAERYDQAMKALKETGADTHAKDGLHARDVMVRGHGEYGPTLTWRGQDFTGPSDI